MNAPRPASRPDPAAQTRLRRVEGHHNALVKDMRRAFSHAELTEAGDCAIEGIRIVEEAIRSGLRFHAVLFSESAEGQAQKLLPQIGAQVETAILPDKLFASVVPSETPQGVAALVRYRQSSVADVLERVALGPLLVVAGLRIRAIWERFCAPRRHLARAGCSWGKARSARSILKSCGARRDRSSGLRWRGPRYWKSCRSFEPKQCVWSQPPRTRV